MKTLLRWIERKGKQERRRPRLFDALLGIRPVQYVAHRLRFVTLRVLLRTCLHLVEIVALSQVFPLEYLGPILVMRHTSTLIQGAWWGALEPQRDALRNAYRRRDFSAFAHISSQWAAYSLLPITLVLVGYAASLLFLPRPFRGISIYDAYAIACGIRTAMELGSRTAHSAVFSVARVRRPLLTFVTVDIIEVFGLLYAWLQVGPFAFAWMLIAVGTLRLAFTLFFVRNTRKQLGLFAPSRSAIQQFTRMRLAHFPWLRSMGFSASNLSLHLDSLAILFLTFYTNASEGLRMRVLLHALAPLLGVGYGWSRIFYFDFKTLERFNSPLLVNRFGRLLDRVALIYPFVLSMLAAPLVEWLIPGLLGNAPWLLLIFVVARSSFALRQIEAFSYVDIRTQWRQLITLFLSLSLGALLLSKGSLRLPLVTAALFVAAFVFPRARPKTYEVKPAAVLHLEAWLSQLLAVESPLHLVAISVNRAQVRSGALRQSLLQFGFSSPLLEGTRSQLLLYVPMSKGDKASIQRRLIEATSGTITHIFVSDAYANGEQLLKVGILETQRLSWLIGGRDLPMMPLRSEASLRSRFRELFPDGVNLTSHQGCLKDLPVEARADLGQLLTQVSSLSSSSRFKASSIRIATYRPQGQVTQLFIVPKTETNREAFAAFQRMVCDVSLQNTLQGLKRRETQICLPVPE
jgi:hypothetical protein